MSIRISMSLLATIALMVFATAPMYVHGEENAGVSADVSVGVGASGSAGSGGSGNESELEMESESEMEMELETENSTSSDDDSDSDSDDMDGEDVNQSDENGETEDNNIGGDKLRVRNMVSVQAVEVRGWDSEEKEQFMATVKTHAQVKSEQDLGNFAKGILVQDDNVTVVESNEEEVKVTYRVPAKFLGIFETTLPATVIVEAKGEGSAQANVSERVKAKFPWMRVFFSIAEDVREAALEEAVEAQVASQIQTEAQFEMKEQARLFQLISNILKVKVSAAANAQAGVGADSQ